MESLSWVRALPGDQQGWGRVGEELKVEEGAGLCCEAAQILAKVFSQLHLFQTESLPELTFCSSLIAPQLLQKGFLASPDLHLFPRTLEVHGKTTPSGWPSVP